MPEDIRITWQEDLMEGDFNFQTDVQDLEPSTGFQTAVIMSLFTDRRAEEDDVLPDSNNLDRRGWWGDLASPEVEGDQIGSRLWLLEREKTLESVLIKAKQYAEESLQWLIEDKAAVKVEAEAERQGVPGSDILVLKVRIYQIDGNKKAKEYSFQWETQRSRA